MSEVTETQVFGNAKGGGIGRVLAEEGLGTNDEGEALED